METVYVVLDFDGSIVDVFLNCEDAEDCVANGDGYEFETHYVQEHYYP